MIRVVSLLAVALAASTPSQGETPIAQSLPGATPEVTMTPDGLVEMHVSDLPLSTVLQLLSIESQRNIIASPAVTGTVTASLYKVSFDEALDAVLVANGAGYKTAGKFIYVYTNEEITAMAEAANPPQTRVYTLSYISSVDASEYLTPLLGEGGSIASSAEPEDGISSDSESGGGNSNASLDFIIVTAKPANLAAIENVLAQIDIRPKQVLIEATILRATLVNDNELGIDFSVVGGVDLEELGAVSQGIQNVALGSLPQDRFEKFNAAAVTDFSGNVSPGGLSIGVLKDSVAVFIRALEQVTDATVLANPKVLALNKQKGQVIVGRRDGYLTTTVTETQAIQTVEFLETGTQLLFRPFIGNDGFVRLELHPEDSVGIVNAQGLPSEQTTEATTNVLVEDGHTILIGGLFREVTTNSKSQIPVLGDVPGIGQLFRSNDDATTREEVIILLTVHVIKDHRRYADASMQQFQNVERMRVGIRSGLMWHGREQIAQAHYRKALQCFSEGDDKMALWNVNISLHNIGRFQPAIELKEKLTNRREWEDEGSSIRTFLSRIIAQERGAVLPSFGRPAPPYVRPDELRGPSGFDNHKPNP